MTVGQDVDERGYIQQQHPQPVTHSEAASVEFWHKYTPAGLQSLPAIDAGRFTVAVIAGVHVRMCGCKINRPTLDHAQSVMSDTIIFPPGTWRGRASNAFGEKQYF